MEDSILLSMKKVLGVSDDMVAFDEQIIMHINSALAQVSQLGVGPPEGLFIADETALWSTLDIPANQLALTRTLVQLKVRILFDPPSTGFLVDAHERQIREHEWRLREMREAALPIEVEEVL